MKKRIRITQKHIDLATKLKSEGELPSQSCVVYQAVKPHIKNKYHQSLGCSSDDISFEVDGIYKSVELPRHAQNVIKTFDNNSNEVRPTSFTLDIPAKFAKK